MDVQIRIDDKTYTFSGGTNVLRRMEAAASTSTQLVTFQEVMRLAQGEPKRGIGPSMTHVVITLWAMLKRHHPELSLDDVGNIVDQVGLVEINAKFEEMLREMVPDPADLKALGIEPNPPAAQTDGRPTPTRRRATTGARSTSTRAKRG